MKSAEILQFFIQNFGFFQPNVFIRYPCMTKCKI